MLYFYSLETIITGQNPVIFRFIFFFFDLEIINFTKYLIRFLHLKEAKINTLKKQVLSQYIFIKSIWTLFCFHLGRIKDFLFKKNYTIIRLNIQDNNN